MALPLPYCFCVHVPEADDRGAHIKRQFTHLGIEDRLRVIPAVPKDSPLVTDYYGRGYDTYWDTLISCFASHLKALRSFLETSDPYAIICEDDICFRKDFHERYAEVIVNMPSECPLLLLSYTIEEWKGLYWAGKDPSQQNLATFTNQTYGALLYRISRSWAVEALRRYDRPFKDIVFGPGDVPIRTSEAITINSRGLIAYPILAIERPNNPSLVGKGDAERQRKHERIFTAWGLHNFHVD